MKGLITDIQRYSLHDGPGIRTTVFMKGCNLHCPWCHNPESQSSQVEEMFFQEKCVRCGHCREGCPTGARRTCGSYMSAAPLLEILKKDCSFYGKDGGVTFSGGEPLLQSGFLTEMLTLCKAEEIGTCIQTALSIQEDQWCSTLKQTDLYLVDIKVLSPEKCKKYTGGDPGLLQKNLAVLGSHGKRVWLRIPAIPDVNDDDAELNRISALILKCPFAERIDTLPIFSHAKRKYQALGREQSEKWFSTEPNRIAAQMAEKLTIFTGRCVGTMQ